MGGTTIENTSGAMAFLATPGAQDAAARELAKLGLSHGLIGPDDLLQIVAEKLLRHFATTDHPLDDIPDAVERYVRVAIRHAAIDLLKATKSRPEEAPLGDESDHAGGIDALLTATHDDALANSAWDDARFWIQLLVDPSKPWTAAAGLAHLTIDEDADLAVPAHVRLPDDPADAQVADWVSLHYAGQTECFVQPETPTVRKRRSRAVGKVHAALGNALTRAGWGRATGGDHAVGDR